MQKRCILCADPDPELRSNLGFLLAGENCVLEETAGGATLLTQLRRNTDLVILPQQLPDMSGFDACTALRRQSAAPVLFLLEKADESAKTLSFSVGGDDCLEKPVSCHELAVRVNNPGAGEGAPAALLRLRGPARRAGAAAAVRRAGGGYRRRYRVAGGSGGTSDGAGVSHRPAAGLLPQQNLLGGEPLREHLGGAVLLQL